MRPAATDISMRDGLLLALRRWPWLFFVPLIVMAVATVTYLQFPVPNRAIAVLNTDAATMERAIGQADLDKIEGVAVWFEAASSSTMVLTGEAMDADLALSAVQSVIGFVPPNEAIWTVLTPGQLLEMRALREYLRVLEARDAEGSTNDQFDPALMRQELAQVRTRIRNLELSDVPADPIPLISKEATIVPTRTPPTRNVVIFSLLATLFATWMTIYGLEQRRLNRLADAP